MSSRNARRWLARAFIASSIGNFRCQIFHFIADREATYTLQYLYRESYSLRPITFRKLILTLFYELFHIFLDSDLSSVIGCSAINFWRHVPTITIQLLLPVDSRITRYCLLTNCFLHFIKFRYTYSILKYLLSRRPSLDLSSYPKHHFCGMKCLKRN